MGDKLKEILGSLKNIKTNLLKPNYDRRRSPYILNKVDEAQGIFGELKREVWLVWCYK